MIAPRRSGFGDPEVKRRYRNDSIMDPTTGLQVGLFSFPIVDHMENPAARTEALWMTGRFEPVGLR